MYQFNNLYKKSQKHRLAPTEWTNDHRVNRFSISSNGNTEDPSQTRPREFTNQLQTEGLQVSQPYYMVNA